MEIRESLKQAVHSDAKKKETLLALDAEILFRRQEVHRRKNQNEIDNYISDIDERITGWD